MNAVTSIRARLGSVFVVAQMGTRFLLVRDHLKASLAVNLSKQLKVKAVLLPTRLPHSLHLVPNLSTNKEKRWQRRRER